MTFAPVQNPGPWTGSATGKPDAEAVQKRREYVVRWRDHPDKYTFNEIGAGMGITLERVRQIYIKAKAS